MSSVKLSILALVAVAFAAFFYFEGGQYLTLAAIKTQQSHIADYYLTQPLQTMLLFFVLYVLITALSLPGAALMTLLAGAIFGLLWGTIIVSFASTLGASLAFLTARFLFREQVQHRFAKQLVTINDNVQRHGGFYLFTLRLVPVVPFFIINLVMGLTKLPLLTFFTVSQVGMLAGTLVYVNAGTQLAQIDSLQGILSLPLLASFVLLGTFPLLAKRAIGYLQGRKLTGHCPD